VAGSVSISVTPIPTYADLDVLLQLLDAQGNVLTSSNPSGMAASFTYNVSAGTYYISIDGVGYGLPASTGYSDYASCGAYTISGTLPSSTVANIFPNVSISSPTDGATFAAPATIPLTASAQDPDGTIQKVEFYNGTTKLGEALSSPYTYTWVNVAIGNYTITAKATDNLGAVSTSSSIAIIVKKADCKVANNEVVYDALIGTLGSYNNNGYTRDLVFDGDSTTYFDGPTTNGCWAGQELDGIYMITGIRYFPRISYTSRVTGGKFQGSNTPDFSSGVVDLATISTTPAAGWNCITIANTTSFKYVRYLSPANSNGNIGEVQFFGTKTPNLDPTVVITSPANNSIVYVPITLTVNVSASDPDGTVVKVELYNDTSKMGQDLASPYSFSLPADTAKQWILIAKVTDNMGEYTLSDTVVIYAKNPVCHINGTLFAPTTLLGTTGSYNNSGNTRDKAFDKDSNTYFDGPSANSSWVGADLGSSRNIVGVRFYPRLNYPNRMLKGRFQVATNATFTQGVVNIDTIVKVYNDEWHCFTFPKIYTNRYIRYLSPAGSYSDVSEIQLYLQGSPVTGVEETWLEQDGFTLFPNPTKESVSVISNRDIAKISLLNLQGVVVKEFATPSSSITLPEDLVNGYYHAIIYFKNGEREVSRLVISR
jgi:hypothetical protein